MGNGNTRHRVFTALKECILTNALYAYCFEYKSVNFSDITYLDTHSKLAKKWIFSIYIQNRFDIRNADT